MKVSYYPGCSLHGTALEYEESTRAVCKMLGIELQELADWTTAANNAFNFGSGSFSLTFSGYDAGPPERINVESSGSFETASRTIDKTFER